jgi:O-antigen/teichoic acid export membrane protein
VCKPAYDNNEHNFYSVIYRPEVGIGYVFLANLIANLVSLVLLSPQLMKVRFSLNRALLTEMLVYSWPLVILGLAGTVNDTMDRILIKELMPDKSEAQNAQGIYGACYKVAMLMTIFTQAFRFASEPFFFSRAKEKNSRQTYALVMKYFVIFCLFIFLGTVLNLSWLQYIVDKEYRVGLRVVPVLLLAYLCYGVIVNLSIWFKLSGRTKFGAVISLFGAVITLTLNFIFVPRYSYIACAWATLAAYSGMMFLSYFLGQKYFPISYNLRAISVYSVIAFSFYGMSFLYNDAPVGLQLILNNLLILLFAWIIYKLEFKNLKKLNSNANPESKGDQPLEASAS